MNNRTPFIQRKTPWPVAVSCSLWMGISCSLGMLVSCGSGDNAKTPEVSEVSNCNGSCASSTTFLASADVQKILAQGIQEAQARNVAATFAVSDRVGNVLAVYRMTNANPNGVEISSGLGANGFQIDGGLEGIVLPGAADTLAAISKAITGAYLSSEGNAFSSRTASQIVQDHFNPGEDFQPAGPLFGVQISQLACSDLTTDVSTGSQGPKQSPLGLSADPGGFPLYKNGTVVGGVGVVADGLYSLDKNLMDTDQNLDEIIAFAASYGFAAPANRRADHITADGKTLRFSDVDASSISSDPNDVSSLAQFSSAVGALQSVSGYFDAAAGVKAGVAFGTAASGIRADTVDYPGLDAFVLVDENNNNRYAPRAGSETAPGIALTQSEVTQILRSALAVANRARAQIRQPLNSQARVTITVVDSTGRVLGLVRTRDAPVFGTDVALQKARTAAFYSNKDTASLIQQLPSVVYLNQDLTVKRSVSLMDYVTDLRSFLGLPSALADGAFAFTDRAGGNLSRPYFPDGINGNEPGPLSKPVGEWSVFSTGFQLDAVYNSIIQHVAFAAGIVPTDVTTGCLGKDAIGSPDVDAGTALANGMQIFPGSAPIFRRDTLVGGIGVSGDGVDQDDMISFLGLHEAGEALATGIGNAPMARRADQLTPRGIRLRYIQCPQAPYLNDDAQNVCEGK